MCGPSGSCDNMSTEEEDDNKDCGNCGNGGGDWTKDPCLSCFCFDNWRPQKYIIPSYGKGIDIVKLVKDIFTGYHKQTTNTITIGLQINIERKYNIEGETCDLLTYRCAICGTGIIEYWYEYLVKNCQHELINPMQERICQYCIDDFKYGGFDWDNAPAINEILIWTLISEKDGAIEQDKNLYYNEKVVFTADELILQKKDEKNRNCYAAIALKSIISLHSDFHKPGSFIWGDESYNYNKPITEAWHIWNSDGSNDSVYDGDDDDDEFDEGEDY